MSLLVMEMPFQLSFRIYFAFDYSNPLYYQNWFFLFARYLEAPTNSTAIANYLMRDFATYSRVSFQKVYLSLEHCSLLATLLTIFSPFFNFTSINEGLRTSFNLLGICLNLSFHHSISSQCIFMEQMYILLIPFILRFVSLHAFFHLLVGPSP